MNCIQNRFALATIAFALFNAAVPLATGDLPTILVGVVGSGLAYVLSLTAWVLQAPTVARNGQ